MPRLDTLVSDEGGILTPQHVMVYGPPKVGKTQLIGKLALAGFKLIWIDGENGKSTLLKLPREALANILYIGIKDTKDAPIFHATMDKLVRGGTFQVCDSHGRVDCQPCKKDSAAFTQVGIPTSFTPEHYKTVVVCDSGTQLSMSVIHTVLAGKSVDYQETMHDYRNQGNYLNRIFSYIQQAPYHFVITAHEIEAEREDGGNRIVPSIGTRNYAITCGKFFDHIVYLDKQNGKHKANSSTGYSNSILTGSRTDISVETMEESSLEDIFAGKVGKQQTSTAHQTKAVLIGLGGVSSNSSPAQTASPPAVGGLKFKVGGIT